MLHRLTLKTCLIRSFLKEHPIKKDQKFSLRVLARRSYSPSDILCIYAQIKGLLKTSPKCFFHKRSDFMTDFFLRKKNVQNHYFWSILIKVVIKKFFRQNLLDNNMTHALKIKFSKNFYYSSFKGFNFCFFRLLVFFLI